MRARGLGRTVWMPIAVVLTLLAGATEGLANNALSAGTRQVALGSTEERFPSSPLRTAEGPLAQIWRVVRIQISADMARMSLCNAQEASCSPAARAVRNIVAEARTRDGLARAGFINRAINLAIRPRVDPFVWRSPLEIMSMGSGDCKEYAVAKYFALLQVGFAEADVKLLIVRDMAAHQHHAIVAVRIGAAWFLLDNRWLALIRDFELPRAEPLFILDEHGVRRYEQEQTGRFTLQEGERALE